MKVYIKNIATVYSGVYAKPNLSGDAFCLQASMFDEFGDLLSGTRPNVAIDKSTFRHLLGSGDVLFAAKGSNNFAVEYKPIIGPAIASSTFLVIRPEVNVVLPSYIVWYLNHPFTQANLKSRAKGSSIPSISKQILIDMEIPLPSIAKQEQILKIQSLRDRERRISKKLEKLKDQLIQDKLLLAAKQ
ncbi:restriction endonuclease subunit S [Rufibacter immobilis]|uniref:restriction endonuclease subunit S n=1 Tax=Rufibacter immobilis TaxID=1348778 RepID=UPI0035EA5388